MAAPVYQAVGTGVGWATGNQAIAWPTHAVDDVAFLFVESCGGSTISLNTANGFVLVGNYNDGGAGTAGTQISVYWCRATSTSMSSPIVANSTDHAFGVITTYRGCIGTGNPWDVFSGNTSTGTLALYSITAITTTVGDTLVVAALASDVDSASAGVSTLVNANLLSPTIRHNAGTATGLGGAVMIGDGRFLIGGGSTGNTTGSMVSSGYRKAMFMMALKGVTAYGDIVQTSAKFQADNVSTSSSFNAAFNFTAGNSVLVAIEHYASAGGGVSGVTIGGMTATRDALSAFSSDATTYIYRVHNFSGSGKAVVISYGGGSDNYVTVSATEVFSLQNAAPNQIRQTVGTGTAVSGTLAAPTTVADCVTIGAATISNGVMTSITSSGGLIDLHKELDGSTHQGGIAGYRRETSTGSINCGWTASASSSWSVVIACYAVNTGSSNGNATGAALTVTASLSVGSGSGVRNPTSAGIAATVTSSLSAGTATGQKNVTAGGAALTVTSSLGAGAASGVRSPTVSGAALTVTSSLSAGSASGVRNPTVSGAALTVTSSL